MLYNVTFQINIQILWDVIFLIPISYNVIFFDINIVGCNLFWYQYCTVRPVLTKYCIVGPFPIQHVFMQNPELIFPFHSSSWCLCSIFPSNNLISKILICIFALFSWSLVLYEKECCSQCYRLFFFLCEEISSPYQGCYSWQWWCLHYFCLCLPKCFTKIVFPDSTGSFLSSVIHPSSVCT